MAFHTITFYGNTPKKTMTKTMLTPYTFHTITFYGNATSSATATTRKSAFPHDYVLRKREGYAVIY
ncbi:hypothetical protein PYCH_00330 [Pyrococcus yayanosii CH1]|uniref:Uncharacterized protein n=1 Tax=Pyrococcus yayanosii (strain CH1 / JCM 16557) TaxID=529709 RepID=F8AFD9_PYRYC|nr:hypothetical protein PYCH_00330 [Pyrococcus yayanosii CH1]